MVIYELKCQFGHGFEGWFKDSAAFEDQKKTGLVQCAMCGTENVDIVPSGCHVGRKSKVVAKTVSSKSVESTKKLPSKESDHVDPVILLKSVHKLIKDNFKDVGKKFTDKAIQIQKGEAEAEPIYGTVTQDDRERLDEEGVSYLPLPKLPESVEN